MGFSLGWLATRNIDPQILYEALQLRPTTMRKPALSSAAMAGALPSGWHLLLMNRTERLVTDAFLAVVSKGGEAVGCFVEEHVDVLGGRGLACWRQGVVRRARQREGNHAPGCCGRCSRCVFSGSNAL